MGGSRLGLFAKGTLGHRHRTDWPHIAAINADSTRTFGRRNRQRLKPAIDPTSHVDIPFPAFHLNAVLTGFDIDIRRRHLNAARIGYRRERFIVGAAVKRLSIGTRQRA